MFERAIAQTIQRVTRETLRERPAIPLEEIISSEQIPGRLKAFFETEVQWWLYDERLAREANKRFDYVHPELAALLNYTEQVQPRHARFEREEFLAVLDSAVKLTYNYLCRPQTTLKWYIFRGQPVKPLREVMLRFGAFVDFEYFRIVFSEWVERKCAERPTFDAISASEFERVIRRTDDQILLNCTVEGLLEIMDPLFEFLSEGDARELPVDSLVVYFDDKNIQKLVDQLEGYRERSGDIITRESFVGLLDELLNSAEGEPEADFSSVYQNDELDDVVRHHLQASTRPQDQPTDTHAPTLAGHKVSAYTESDSADLHVTYSEQSFGERFSDSFGDEENISDNSLWLSENDSGPSEGRRLLDAENPSVVLSPSELQDVRSYINEALERKVLKKIFGRNRAAYEDVIARINATESWRPASEVLSLLYREYGIDPDSRTAIRLTDSVYGRYIPSRN